MPAADIYEKPHDINPDALDWEWMRQGKLTRRACRDEADARHDHAQAKARLDLAEAQIKFEIRSNPTAYGLSEKPTVGDITAAMTIEPKYQAALAEVNESKRDLDYLSGDVTALVDKRKGLERMVELISIDYHTDREPRAHTPAAREVIEARTKEAVRSETKVSAPPKRGRS